MFEDYRWKTLDGIPGYIQPDASLECGDGTNGDRHVSPTPKVPLLKEDVGHIVGLTFDYEPLDHSDFAVRGMNAIASVDPHLTQGERITRDGQPGIRSSRPVCQSKPVVGQGKRLSGSVGRVTDASRHELDLFGHLEVLEGR